MCENQGGVKKKSTSPRTEVQFPVFAHPANEYLGFDLFEEGFVGGRTPEIAIEIAIAIEIEMAWEMVHGQLDCFFLLLDENFPDYSRYGIRSRCR